MIISFCVFRITLDVQGRTALRDECLIMQDIVGV